MTHRHRIAHDPEASPRVDRAGPGRGWKLVAPASVALLLACDGRPVSGPDEPVTAPLTVVLEYDAAEASLAGADSALVRVFRLHGATDQRPELRRVALTSAGGRASAAFELPLPAAYHVAVLAYNSSTRGAFAGAEHEHAHVGAPTDDQQRTLTVPLVRWRAELNAPFARVAEQMAGYRIRIVERPPRLLPFSAIQSPGGSLVATDVFVRAWGVIAALEPWTSDTRPAPLPRLHGFGWSGGGWPPEITYTFYHPAPAVDQDTLLYAQAFFELGGPAWRASAGAEPPLFTLFTEPIESVRVSPR